MQNGRGLVACMIESPLASLSLQTQQYVKWRRGDLEACDSGAVSVWSVTVDSNEMSRWFGEYLDAFAACGRGEAETDSLLEYYGVPLLVTTDDGFFAVTTNDQVVAVLQQQVDGMRAASYNRSEVLASEVTVLNATSAIYRGTFSRQRGDGSEINRLTASYLVTEGTDGRGISVLAVHSA